MDKLEPRKYYNEKCYALKNCLHCPDCLAFALRYFRELPKEREESKKGLDARSLVTKFLLMTISAESLPCADALTSKELKSYIGLLFEEKEELPICHYEFSG